MTQLKNPGGLILFSLFIGWLADMLFYGKRLGISVILFIAIFGTGFWVLGQLEGQKLKKGNLWLAAPLLFCATMVMVRANSALTLLNMLICGFCLVLLGIFMTTGKSYSLGLLGFTTLPFRALGNMAIRPWPLVNENLDFEAIQVTSRDTVYPVLRGAVLAVPVLAVFMGLLVSADAVFAQTMLRVFDIQISAEIFNFLWRGCIIFGISWVAIGYMAYALRSSVNVPRPFPERVLGKIRGTLPLGTIESFTILLLVNLLFGAFVSIQFAYLFGGRNFVSLDGISYSAYARRGFFELVVVACLTLLLIQLMNWFTVKKFNRDRFYFNLFSSLIIGFVLVMLVSAFQRLSLYEWTFGFTQLRIFSHTFIVWMGIALIWYVITLWLRPDRFAIGALLCLFGFVISLNLLNPDALIVRRNVQRYRTVGHLDLEYLIELSADAVPDLIKLTGEIENDLIIHSGNECTSRFWGDLETSLQSREEERGSSSNSCIESSHPGLLKENLQARYDQYQNDPSWSRWQSFHLTHTRVRVGLQEILGE